MRLAARAGDDPRLGRTLAHYAPAFAAAFLLHALAAAIAGGWFTLPSNPVRPQKQAGAGLVVFSIPPEDSRFPGLNVLPAGDRDWLKAGDTPASISQGDFAFDVSKIAAHADVLFPFLTPGLAWDHFVMQREPSTDSRLQNPFGAASRKSRDRSMPAWDTDDAELQKVVDSAWSRRHRWDAFQPVVSLTRKHSADAGRVPDLLQRYCDQNSLQPYVDTTMKDPRLWVQLGIAADHVDFIGFIRRYAAEHPSSRATTALLFLLDNIAQSSRDALAPLLEANPKDDLRWTRQANPRAYELVLRIRDHYRRELNRRGLTSAEAITRHYERVRLAILEQIVRTSPDGYRASDARFVMGSIYWRQQQFDRALASWREMTLDPRDSHVATYSQIAAVLKQYRSRTSAAADRSLARDINQIMKNTNGQWFMSSYDRLEHFGFKVDTF